MLRRLGDRVVTYRTITFSSQPSLSHLLVFAEDPTEFPPDPSFCKTASLLPLRCGILASSCCFLALQMERSALAATKSMNVHKRAMVIFDEGSTTVLKTER